MSHPPMPPAMILCGGQGTRLRDVSGTIPKPMVPVGPQPIVWHVMKCHAAFGVKRFILCLGHRREAFVDWLLNYRAYATDVTIRLGETGGVVHHGGHEAEDWEVTLADTGEQAMTGARVARAAKHLAADDEDFFLTYGDGLADVDVAELLAHHQEHGRRLTVTAVQPASRFGELDFADEKVTRFREKPPGAAWINGGYMACRREFVDEYLAEDEGCILERDPMQRAVADGQMSARRHEGFWQCLDTAREHALLNELWAAGDAPWTTHWPRA